MGYKANFSACKARQQRYEQIISKNKAVQGVGTPSEEGRGERVLALKVKKAEVSITVFIMWSIPLYGDFSSHTNASLPRL